MGLSTGLIIGCVIGLVCVVIKIHMKMYGGFAPKQSVAEMQKDTDYYKSISIRAEQERKLLQYSDVGASVGFAHTGFLGELS